MELLWCMYKAFPGNNNNGFYYTEQMHAHHISNNQTTSVRGFSRRAFRSTWACAWTVRSTDCVIVVVAGHKLKYVILAFACRSPLPVPLSPPVPTLKGKKVPDCASGTRTQEMYNHWRTKSKQVSIDIDVPALLSWLIQILASNYIFVPLTRRLWNTKLIYWS